MTYALSKTKVLSDYPSSVFFSEKVKPNIQAVIKLEDEEAPSTGNDTKKDQEGGGGGDVIKLVDAEDNQFVMSKGKDSTVPHEDHQFIAVS